MVIVTGRKGEAMRNIKCSDCAEYRNEWCEKIVDSPYPDMLRDCQYWHERKDMVEVIRCKDCKHCQKDTIFKKLYCDGREVVADGYCWKGERDD